jgi:hypothetical protein
MSTEVLRKFSTKSKVPSWSINKPEENSTVAIYLFDSARIPGTGLGTFRHNCRYLGDGRRIVCDIALFRELTRRYDLDRREKTLSDASGIISHRYLVAEDEETVSRRYKAMMTWVFGHEIGHLVRRHVGSAYFEEHSFERPMPPRNYCHRVELEADEFLIASLPPEKGAFDDLYLFVYDLLNREIKRQTCPDQSVAGYCDKISPGTGLLISPKPLEYADRGSHPDYVIRLLRILDAIQQRDDFGLLAYQASQLFRHGILKRPDPKTFTKPCRTG